MSTSPQAKAHRRFRSDPALPNLVVLRTFSKSFSLAGMRIGLAFASEEIIAGMMKVKDSYNLNRLSMVAATAALAGSALDDAQRAAHSTQPQKTGACAQAHGLRRLPVPC